MNRRTFIKSVGYSGAVMSASWNSSVFAFGLSPSLTTLKSFEFEIVKLDHQGQEILRRKHQASYFSESLDGGIEIDMVHIPPSRYLMGASEAECNRGVYDSYLHQVDITSAFMSKTSVTQRQWQAVSKMPKVNRDLMARPAHFKGGEHPIESISWLDAVEFCDRLSTHSGKKYSLPNEELWEKACRASSTTPFHFGSTVTSDHANYGAAHTYASEQAGTPLRTTKAVGQYLPNAYGLYDMHGNVWEWCSDSWQENYRKKSNTSATMASGVHPVRRVVRGGAWADEPEKLRSANRSGYAADSLNRIIGFRVSIESV